MQGRDVETLTRERSSRTRLVLEPKLEFVVAGEEGTALVPLGRKDGRLAGYEGSRGSGGLRR